VKSIKRSQIASMNIQYKYYPFLQFLEDTLRCGISNIEMWGAAPHFYSEDMTYHDICNIRHEIEQRGLRLICYTPEQCIYPINLSAPYASERIRSLHYFEQAIRIAADLGTDKVLVTSGTGYFNGSDKEEAWKYAVDNIRALGEMAENYKIKLVLEVLRKDESNLVYNLNTLKQMLIEIDQDSVGAVADTIPMALAKETPATYFSVLKEKLIHFHFVDGTPSGHLAWGDGVLDMRKYLLELSKYEYQGYLTLEITDGRYFINPKDSLYRSVNQLFSVIDEG